MIGVTAAIKDFLGNMHEGKVWPSDDVLSMNNPQIVRDLQADPFLFFRDYLGMTRREDMEYGLWRGQEEIVRSVAVNERTSVASGHALGKDYIAARIILWFLLTYIPSIVIATSSTDRQVDKVIWGELGEAFHGARVKLRGRLITKQLIVDEIKRWYAMGFATKDIHKMPGKFQGFHQVNVMILFSEAQAIERSIWESAESLMTGENVRWLAIGNPRINYGAFYDTFKAGSGWGNIHLDCEDSPNVREGRMVVPGLCSRRWVEGMEKKLGRNHPLFVSMVKGRFPKKIEGTFIEAEWIDWANTHGMNMVSDEGRTVVGCDPAAYGDDKTVITVRRGMRVVRIDKHEHQSTTETTGQLVSLLKQGADRINLDVTGIGTGIYDRLVELGHAKKVVPINFGGRPRDEIEGEKSPLKNVEKYADLGTQMYDKLAELLQRWSCGFPFDEELSVQLLNRRMLTRSDGKKKIEPKDQFRERGFDSPDEADSLVLAYCDVPPPGHAEDPFIDVDETDKGVADLWQR